MKSCPGAAEIITEVKVEAAFDDGTRLAATPSP
jgi:urease gamma subunit